MRRRIPERYQRQEIFTKKALAAEHMSPFEHEVDLDERGVVVLESLEVHRDVLVVEVDIDVLGTDGGLGRIDDRFEDGRQVRVLGQRHDVPLEVRLRYLAGLRDVGEVEDDALTVDEDLERSMAEAARLDS